MKILFAAGLAVSMIVVMHAAQTQTLYGSGDDPLVAGVLGTEIHTRDADEMSYVILSKLVDRYAAEQDIGVEPAEIDAYVESVHRSMQQDRLQHQARRDELPDGLRISDAGKM